MLRIGLLGAPISIDPHRQNDTVSGSILTNVYDTLTEVKGVGVRPALAESWRSPDEFTWIFDLRHDVIFHDGRPMTSRDVIFSLIRTRDIDGGRGWAFLSGLKGMEALNDFSVKTTTPDPDPILARELASLMIVPEGTEGDIEKPIGTGPYRLADFLEGKVATLRVFEDYWWSEALLFQSRDTDSGRAQQPFS